MTERPQKIAFGEMRDGRVWSCGNRGADVRPDFHLDKKPAAMALPGTFRARRALRTLSRRDRKPGGGSWILSLWTSKESASSVWPPDFGSRRNRLQLQSIGLKNRINS